MAKALMIQATGSGVGKSLIVTALCRIFNNRRIKVAPFKAQNMALNSYVTKEGGEIGRAQALQAEGARIEPSVHMNPVLLKASGERSSQVIIHGKIHSTMNAKEYYSFKKTAWEAVVESFERLSKNYELIILEGAGSPAEINLMDKEIVNMRMARYSRAPVILVGDIDRGGVFASLYGTVKLLGRNARYIKAFVINKFRGDLEILTPGLQMIKEKTGRPVIGVLPYVKNIGLPEEDGLVFQERSLLRRSNRHCYFSHHSDARIKIVVVRLKYISNFTDFDPFLYEPDVELIYSENPIDIENADIVIIPGTKNTVKDLLFLREQHLDKSIKRAYEKGIQVIGICGGYQILGQRIYDPNCVESPYEEIEGLGLLEIETTFRMTKITCQVEAELNQQFPYPTGTSPFSQNLKLKGYEIHMGESSGKIGLFKIKRLPTTVTLLLTDGTPSTITSPSLTSPSLTSPPTNTSPSTEHLDGSINNNCWGTYLHGIFENDCFRRAIINSARIKKAFDPIDTGIRYQALKDEAIENLAEMVESNLDISYLERLL